MSTAILLAWWLLSSVAIHQSLGARILGLFPDLSGSHTTQSRPLFRALAARGHHVTILTGYPDPAPPPNYRDIVIDGLPQFVDQVLRIEDVAASSLLEALVRQATNPFGGSVDLVIDSNATQSLLRSNDTFDLIFLDLTYSLFNLGFVHKFNHPPFIGIVPFGSNLIGDAFAGDPASPSCVPNVLLPLTDQMGFFERLVNAVDYAASYYFYSDVFAAEQDQLMRRHFGEGVPSAWTIARNMSLLMVNTDAAHDYARPRGPMTVEIGGLHLVPAGPLPKDIGEFIEGSLPGGVVYFSLGSLLHSDKMAVDRLRAVLGALRALRMRVLWKWEAARPPPGLSDNVMVRSWLPQNDVLGHPNVRLFVTHGGISSLEEAVYHAVPMVVVPLLGDQFYQAAKMARHGIAVKVDYKTMTQHTLLAAITEVLGNDSYRANVARLSRVSRDKIASPLATAVFWTEYVLRHGGGQHLRPAAAFLPWSRYFLVDVLAALAAAAVAVVALSVAAGRALAVGRRRVRLRTWMHRLVPKYGLATFVRQRQADVVTTAKLK